MITRQQLEIINRKTLKYPLHIAEKDYLLTLVLQGITQSSLGKRLVFKGGTAVHHCYLQQHRFSEDLDFSANQTPVALEDVHQIFTTFDFLKSKEYRSDATVKIEKLQYVGPLVQPNSLKVEIDFCKMWFCLPQVLPYQNVWGVEYTVSVMDIREICAEKSGLWAIVPGTVILWPILILDTLHWSDRGSQFDTPKRRWDNPSPKPALTKLAYCFNP